MGASARRGGARRLRGGVESSKVSTGKAAGDNGIRFADPIALPSNPAPQRPGLGWAVQRTIGLSWAVAALALVALANCSSQPASIVADDEALCRYSAATVGPNRSEAQAYANCRARIGQSRTTTLAANASAIAGVRSRLPSSTMIISAAISRVSSACRSRRTVSSS